MKPAAPVTRSRISPSLLALRAGVVDLAAVALQLFGAVQVPECLGALPLLGEGTPQVVLRVGLVKLARSFQLANRLPCDDLGLGPPAHSQQGCCLVRQLDATLPRRRGRWRRRRFRLRSHGHVRRDRLTLRRDRLSLHDGARGLLLSAEDARKSQTTAEKPKREQKQCGYDDASRPRCL